MFQYTSNYQFTSPSGTSGVAVTPSGVAWANSPWAEIHPGTDFDWALTSVILCNRGTTADYEVDIGVVPVSGAVSGSTVISTLKGMVRSLSTYGYGNMPLPIPVDKIPSGRRVAVRMRKSGTSTAQWSWAIQYYKKPITGNLQLTTQAMKALPSAASPVTLNAAAVAWDWGTWVTISASAPANMVIAAIGVSQPFTFTDVELQIGVGGVGSEVVLTTLKGFESNTVTTPGYYPLPNPVSGITAGSRIAARFRKEGTSTTGPDIHLCYYETPV